MPVVWWLSGLTCTAENFTTKAGAQKYAAAHNLIVIAPDTSRMGLFKHAAALAFGVAKPQTDYEMHCGDEIDITIGRRRRAVARDGELERMKGPFKLRILDRPLKIIVPKGQEAGIR